MQNDIPIGEALHRLLHAYRRAMRQSYRAAGIELAVSHIRSLKVIRHHQQRLLQPCTAQAIAADIERDKAQIARVVRDLLEKALIEKRPNPEDGRSQILQLTSAGEAMLERIGNAEHQASLRMAQGLSPDELTAFIRLASAMTDNLSPAT
ncbi:MarR family transcriptional regulator [Marinobacterium nitratireducens]|uniref:MarR family transcriptional regulator n=1 Tax=Marinobacterium nitratireducens TaxID=518897 RepID=A0A918DSG7_9GAMM|nr:MarR family transcriptional regulator [Marinobacterium nitratireducens]GGO80294.1 MarR family transcriptional regulator [Marinobacterium nitratireducens]